MFEEYSNAERLYSRCISIFKNMPKSQKESLTEEQKQQRNQILNTLYANCALCFLKKGQYPNCIKSCKNANEFDAGNAKVYYRMALAYKAENDFDRSQDNFKEAIRLDPQNAQLRTEYKQLLETKNKKEREWYSKMKGFYHKEGVNRIIEKDEQRQVLKDKIRRQTFQENPEEPHLQAAASQDQH